MSLFRRSGKRRVVVPTTGVTSVTSQRQAQGAHEASDDDDIGASADASRKAEAERRQQEGYRRSAARFAAFMAMRRR